jgi:hypothetical protein
MKKLLIFLVAVSTAALSYGQLHFGPQIGYTASKLSVDQGDIENGMKNNFLIGAFVRMGKKIYIQPEVNYYTQGSIFKTPSISGGISPLEQEISLKSLQVPLNVGWRMINLEIVNIRLFGGVVANFVLDKTVNTTSGNADDYETALIPEDFKDSNWQYDVGVGVDVLMFAVDIKYVGGLSNILNDVQFDGNTVTSKSNLFVVTLGWKIF